MKKQKKRECRTRNIVRHAFETETHTKRGKGYQTNFLTSRFSGIAPYKQRVAASRSNPSILVS
ncbi:hypothetical protein [Bacteroides pyogenes]|uniref:hypothetical protein n=1 Tax=Bacteroides pyogenes TaxID=310300 RepID=UPI0012DECE6E|nr:hypothetical protein [Bacteroides pyogenes]MBB3893998.1 hypothetical protein [Bacteroides pyogenes]